MWFCKCSHTRRLPYDLDYGAAPTFQRCVEEELTQCPKLRCSSCAKPSPFHWFLEHCKSGLLLVATSMHASSHINGERSQVVDLATGAVGRTFPGDTEPITSIAVSPNGRHIFAASRSLVTKCWDLQTGQCHRTWRVWRPPLSWLQPGDYHTECE